jgi:hypothetical protein
MSRPAESGAALVEFHLVSLLVMLPMLLGILQVALIGTGYHVLALAAREAARAGAVDHARIDSMQRALAEQLLPLVVDLTRVNAQGGPPDFVADGLARAMEEVALYSDVQRIAPTREDFSDHARTRGGVSGIPNDALEFRSDAPGRTSGRSVQQANLLRIEVLYCHRLVVPFIDRILLSLLQRLDGDASHQRCYAADRLPLRVFSNAPMQSEARQ